jgi:hypothetical protein
MAIGEKKTDAQKVAELRRMAEDKTLPQAVRNSYLDRANELERTGYEKMRMKEGLNMAKGGKVSSKAKAKPAIAIVIGAAPKKMAKGGDMKMGYAKGGMAMVEKDGKMVPSFAADGVGKMAKGGKVSAPIKEYGGKEKYASKTAMMKHEKKEPMKMEKKEKEMAKGGTVKCATGGAIKKKPMKGVINKFV